MNNESKTEIFLKEIRFQKVHLKTRKMFDI